MTVVLRAQADTDSIESVVAGLIRSWNAGEARAFAGFFAEDADLVNIHGMHLRGRQSIAGIYEMLFRSVFLGSNTIVGASSTRMLRKNLALVHVECSMTIPVPPMTGTHKIVSSGVMVHEASHWKIAAMHNTMVKLT